MRERRRSSRFHLQGRVRLDLGERHWEFPSADVSVGGIGVMLDSTVPGTRPAGEVGICVIDSPDLTGPVQAYVSVMRVRRIGHRYLLGLRFDSIGDEQLAVIRHFESHCRAGQALPAS